MLTVFLRATILFLLAVAAMRMMGKRQVGQLQPFEFVIALMIAELAAAPMGDVGIPLLYGIVPMMALVIVHSLLSIGSMKSQRFRRFLSGKPIVLIKHGEIQVNEMRKLCYNLADLLEELRGYGVLNPADAGTAVMETSGRLSVFPHADKRAVTPEDLHLTVDYEGIPLTLVMDGVIQKENLVLGGLDENWLQAKLDEMDMGCIEQVLLCSLDTKGMLFAQSSGDQARVRIFQALTQDQVRW